MKSFLLYLAAILLSVIFLPLGFLFSFLKTLLSKNYKDVGRVLGIKLESMAVSLDCFGNVVCDDLFNLTLIMPKSVNKFGNRKETISSVLGKNQEDKTLTWLGQVICYFLNIIQKNHTEKSIDNNI